MVSPGRRAAADAEPADEQPADEQPAGWRYGELRSADVVEAALRFARREGLENLTMRKLATELGVSSMSAYYYVASKQALFDLVADSVLGQVTEPPATDGWADQMRWLYLQAWQLLIDHPGVADHLLTRAEDQPNSRRLYLLTRAIMADAGFGRRTILLTQRALTNLLFGSVSQELAALKVSGKAPSKLAGGLPVFELGMDLMLEALDARRALPPKRPERGGAVRRPRPRS